VIPDLGTYAGPVLSAYGFSLVLLLAIVWASVRRARRAARDLTDAEAGRHG